MSVWFGVARPHILAIVFASTLTYGWIFTEQHTFLIPALAVWDWFIVNFMNKATDVAEDLANGIRGAEAVARHQRKMELASAAMIIGGLAIGVLWVPALTPYRILFTAIGLAYNYRIIPWRVRGGFGLTRFKEMYFFKNFGSSMLFTLSVFVYPLVGLGVDGVYPWPKVALAILFFIPLELTYEIIYDLRDIDGDTRERVPTYPVVHGARVAKRIIYGLLLFSAVWPIAGAALEILRLREWLVIAGVVQQFILMRRFCGGDRMPTSAECIQITWIGALQLMSYNVWVALGLPLGA